MQLDLPTYQSDVICECSHDIIRFEAHLTLVPHKEYILTGPQITPPHDTNILQSINQNLKPKEGQSSFSEDLSGFKENLINPKDFVDGYYNTLKKMVYDESMNSKFDKKIVYSAMHGI